jgi:hypothetical protein
MSFFSESCVLKTLKFSFLNGSTVRGFVHADILKFHDNKDRTGMYLFVSGQSLYFLIFDDRLSMKSQLICVSLAATGTVSRIITLL